MRSGCPSGPAATGRSEPRRMPELLGAMSVGRIAYTTDDGPRVLPVNYVLEGESVVFRTVSDGEVHRHANIARPWRSGRPGCSRAGRAATPPGSAIRPLRRCCVWRRTSAAPRLRSSAAIWIQRAPRRASPDGWPTATLPVTTGIGTRSGPGRTESADRSPDRRLAEALRAVLRPGSSLSKAADACPRAILGLPLHLGRG
jgi:hypothetical protein